MLWREICVFIRLCCVVIPRPPPRLGTDRDARWATPAAAASPGSRPGHPAGRLGVWFPGCLSLLDPGHGVP